MLSLLRKDSQQYINRGFDGKETNVTGDTKALWGKSICHGLYTHLNTCGKDLNKFKLLHRYSELKTTKPKSMSTYQ